MHSDPEHLALIHYLLDNGASPNEGQFHEWCALMPALWWDQPFEVIEKMVCRGVVIACVPFQEAVKKERLDVLRLFLEKGRFHNNVSHQELLESAREFGNEAIISVVEAGVARRERIAKWYRRASW